MVNYSNGKVYKIEPICEHDEGDVYFGSTTKQYLSQRFDDHRGKFKNMNVSCSSKFLFQKYGIENCVIILLESVNATTKDELLAVEAKYIINNACVNKRIPLRTSKQYKADNVEKINQYRINNADVIQKQRKQYRIDNAEKIKETKKQYRINNRDEINENQRRKRLLKKEQADSENIDA